MKLKFFVFVLALLVLPSIVFAAQNCTKEDGKDYFTVGTAMVGTDNYTDECIGDKRLVEYYCNDQGLLEYDYYDCPVLCFEGACTGTIPSNETNLTCVEDWQCSDWSDCVNNLQVRTCEDENNCNTTLSKPLESQSCTVPPPVTPPSSGFAKYRYYIIGGVVLILIILYFVLRKKEPEIKEVPAEKKEEK